MQRDMYETVRHVARAAFGWLLLLTAGLLFVGSVTAARPDPPLAVTGSSFPLSAPSLVELEGRTDPLPLSGRIGFWLDRGGRADVDAVVSGLASAFVTRPPGHAVVMQGDALWLWLRVRTPTDGSHWLLQVDLPGVDEVRLYHRDAAGEWVVQRAGDQLPQSVWPRRGRAPVFALSPQPGQAVDYWVRVRHERVPFSAELWLKTDVHVAEENSRGQFLLGAYFGLAALSLAVAAAQAIAHRDRGFAAYVPYIGAMALAQAGITGLGGELFWPEWPQLNHPTTFFMPLFAGAAGTWFVRVIANPRQHSELLDRMTLAFIAVLLLVSLADLAWPTIPGFEFSMMLLSASMLLVFLMLGVALARGDRHARWVAAGFALVLLGGLAPVARNFGLLESGFLSEYGLMLGSAIEMPVLFYGLHRRLTEQTESQARAQTLATTDPLTGLATRRRLIELLGPAIARARTERPAALLLVQMPHHGNFQRGHGREAADRALVLTAARLRRLVRPGDTVARVADDQFALLMEQPCPLALAQQTATAVVAQGLRTSALVEDPQALRLHVALALLPHPPLDADGVLRALQVELAQIQREPKRAIRTLGS